MQKARKSFSLFIILVVIAGLLGCSLMPQALKSMLASPTPTSTLTPIPSNTSTATPDPTATATVEKLPLEIATCFNETDCPEAVGPAAFLPEGIQKDTTNEVTLPFDQTLKLTYGWVAKDQQHLDQNLQHIKWVFTIDDVDYFTEDLLVNAGVDDPDNPGATNPGTWLAVTLSGWEVNKPHFIRYGYYLDEAIDDGWSLTEADQSAITTLHVMPAKIPTITPGPTVTNTPLPKPAVTKAPVQPTATQGAPLELNITLKVENKCSDAHVVIFNGPMRLKYTVGPGQTVEYQAAAGTYTWKIDNTYDGGPQTLDASMGWWTYTLCQ